MNIMDREEAVLIINKFLQSNNISDAVKLLTEYCVIKEVPQEHVDQIVPLLYDPMVGGVIIMRTLSALGEHFKLIELSKDNNPILVF